MTICMLLKCPECGKDLVLIPDGSGNYHCPKCSPELDKKAPLY